MCIDVILAAHSSKMIFLNTFSVNEIQKVVIDSWNIFKLHFGGLWLTVKSEEGMFFGQ